RGTVHGDGSKPASLDQQESVTFEMALTTAQIIDNYAGRLDTHGATGGPVPLATEPFFISVNSSVHFLLPQLEQPGGLVTPGDGQFTPAIFNPFDSWASMPAMSPRPAIARGQAIFNSNHLNLCWLQCTHPV